MYVTVCIYIHVCIERVRASEGVYQPLPHGLPRTKLQATNGAGRPNPGDQAVHEAGQLG